MDTADVQQALAQTRQTVAAVEQKTNRALTWHNLAQVAAKVMLALACCLWFRAQWIYIGPSLTQGLDGIVSGALDVAMVGGLAFACATVPPIFWSSLIPDTPANTLLTRLYARYSLAGFLFVCVGAIAFTFYSYDVLVSYYASRAFVAAGGDREIIKQAVIALFLLVGFPAWALNKMTPEQWIDAVTQAREVARIQRAIELEEGVFRALHARAIALFQADVASMTVEQLTARNVEVAAIMATFARAEQHAMHNVAATFQSLYGMELLVPSTPDAAITEKFRQVARALADGAAAHGRTGDYSEAQHQYLLATATPALGERACATVPQQEAETDQRATARERPQSPAPAPVAGRHGPTAAPGAPAPDALEAARAALGRESWMRTDLEAKLHIRKSKALDLIAAWRAAGALVDVSDPANHYRFVGEERA